MHTQQKAHTKNRANKITKPINSRNISIHKENVWVIKAAPQHRVFASSKNKKDEYCVCTVSNTWMFLFSCEFVWICYIESIALHEFMRYQMSKCVCVYVCMCIYICIGIIITNAKRPHANKNLRYTNAIKRPNDRATFRLMVFLCLLKYLLFPNVVLHTTCMCLFLTCQSYRLWLIQVTNILGLVVFVARFWIASESEVKRKRENEGAKEWRKRRHTDTGT